MENLGDNILVREMGIKKRIIVGIIIIVGNDKRDCCEEVITHLKSREEMKPSYWRVCSTGMLFISMLFVKA